MRLAVTIQCQPDCDGSADYEHAEQCPNVVVGKGVEEEIKNIHLTAFAVRSICREIETKVRPRSLYDCIVGRFDFQ